MSLRQCEASLWDTTSNENVFLTASGLLTTDYYFQRRVNYVHLSLWR